LEPDRAGASDDQSLNDLYPGRLRFTVNGTDLSPKALVPFLGVVAPMNEFLAAVPPPKSASWAPSDQLSCHAYTIQRIPSGRVHVAASWLDPTGHPVIICVMAERIDGISAARVIRDAVLTALSAWGVPEESPAFRGLRVAGFSNP
jgi:hypothetical protein